MSARRRQPKGARPYLGLDLFDLNGATLAKLLEDLEKYLHKAGMTSVDLTKLASGISYAVQWYGAELYVADYLEKPTLRDLEDLLPRVIEVLKRAENEDPVMIALAGIPVSNSLDIERGVERRKGAHFRPRKDCRNPTAGNARQGTPQEGSSLRAHTSSCERLARCNARGVHLAME
jgi:hypothetical protein